MKRIGLTLPFVWMLGLTFAGEIRAQQQDAGPLPPPTSAAPAASPEAAPANPASASTPAANGPRILVPVGTRLPLVLHNGISTRNAHPGDPLYFETLYPVLVGEHIVIPAGSYVHGEITEAKRPGRIKGRGEVMIRLNSMILPNGYVVSFLASPTGASAGDDDEVDKEGKIKGPSNKTSDAGTVLLGTGAGAGIGAAAAGAKGAGVGAAIGALTGLAIVMLTRGPELELPRGTTVDISLDRPLYLDAARVQFTDPGHASTLPGPSSREPGRPGRVSPY